MSFPAAAAPECVPCKICGTPAPYYGFVDFNKACLDSIGVGMPVYGFAVYYRRCPSCEFLFTDEHDPKPGVGSGSQLTLFGTAESTAGTTSSAPFEDNNG